MDNVEQIKEDHKEELLSRANVVGVGVGEKHAGGETTGEQSIIVFVKEKLPADELSPMELVPKEIHGVKTDVIEVGDLRPMTVDETVGETNALSAAGEPNRARTRPLCGGISCIQSKGTACTLASIVYRDGKPLILQNAHCAFPHWSGIQAGEPVMQPSPYDGGNIAADKIGNALEVCELKFDGSYNKFDSALVSLDDGIEFKDCYQFGIGAHSPKTATVKVGEEVVKSGRTTGVQRAKVIAVNATAQVNYGDGKIAIFENQIFTENEGARFVDGGDSSSLVLNAAGNPVAQVFAGSTKVAILSPIDAIMKHFGISFSKESAVGQGYVALTRASNIRPYVEIYPASAKAGNRGDLDYNMNLRSAPSTNAPALAVLKAGTKFEILEVINQPDGQTWGRIKLL